MIAHTQHTHTVRRGLTLLELILALTITAMVAVAIGGMMHAVSTGVVTRRDTRELLVRASQAQARLAAYVAPSRCLLNEDGTSAVIWMVDSRQSGTVHASEVRWLSFDPVKNVINVQFLSFPDSWSQAARDLEDKVHPVTSDWNTVLLSYKAKSLIASMILVDAIAGVTITKDKTTPITSRHLNWLLDFEASNNETREVLVSATIQQHQTPTM